MNIKDFIYQKKGLFIDQLNKRYFDQNNSDTDISKNINAKQKQLTITFALTFCEKMFVQIINSAESYIQAFVEIAKGASIVDLDDTQSLTQRELIFNGASPDEFKKIVRKDGNNPLSKIYASRL